MKINKLALKNFRCFEEFNIDLDPQYTIIVGVNGAGKSSVLDALSIALGAYTSGFDGINGNSIQVTDAHYKPFLAGSRIDVQEQFPVKVSAEGEFEEQRDTLSWERALNGQNKRTTHGDAADIIEYAHRLQNEVRLGNSDCILPLVAYYGTGRLWMQKKSKKETASASNNKERKLTRQMGYTDCLDIASNEKQMLKWFKEMTYIRLQEGNLLPELEAVKSALKKCYMSVDTAITDAEFTFDVKSNELEVTTHRGNDVEKMPVKMLSDGEKGVISLVADIAYRMALLNPGMLNKVLQTPGIVLVDEIDMHLHPLWQKKIVNDLVTIFPNVQFVLTTHSPSVLANVKKEHIRVLDHYKLYSPQNTTYGRDIEEILREIMGVEVRPDEVINLKDKFDNLIDKEDYKAAEECLTELRELLGDNAREVIESQISLDVEMLG